MNVPMTIFNKKYSTIDHAASISMALVINQA